MHDFFCFLIIQGRLRTDTCELLQGHVFEIQDGVIQSHNHHKQFIIDVPQQSLKVLKDSKRTELKFLTNAG